jgi:hypothetical protein
MVFGMLGPLTLWTADGQPVSIRRRKARWLLTVLLWQRNRDVPAAALVEWLWGGAPPASAHANLHNYVSDLRRALARTSAAGALHTTQTGYLLQVRPGQFDVDRFDDLISRGQEEQAAGLWRGHTAESDAPDVARWWLRELTTRHLEVRTGYAPPTAADELAAHVRAALRAGLSVTEVLQTLWHAAEYVGGSVGGTKIQKAG